MNILLDIKLSKIDLLSTNAENETIFFSANKFLMLDSGQLVKLTEHIVLFPVTSLLQNKSQLTFSHFMLFM